MSQTPNSTPAGQVPVLLALGSNLGDRAANLRGGLALLDDGDEVHVLRVSRFRDTAPVGGPPQPDYLNGAALLETRLRPRALLARLKEIEAALGRALGGPRWGPRVLDLDLLLHGAEVVSEPGLVVPHPRMAGRQFVLEPAAEVAPAMIHPVLGCTLSQLLESLP